MFFFNAASAALADDELAIRSFQQTIDEERAYRTDIDAVATLWANDLMDLYAPAGTFNVVNVKAAWLAVSLKGIVAPYDLVHAEHSLFGSRSRFVRSLLGSRVFWSQVQVRCQQFYGIDKSKNYNCAGRLRRDLELSQAIASNASLLVAGGLTVTLSKALYRKVLKNWIVTRVVPVVPVAMRSKWFLVGTIATIVIVPTSFIVASIRDDISAGADGLAGLELALIDRQSAIEEASVMRIKKLELERDVLEFSIWLGRQVSQDILPETIDLQGPHVQSLQKRLPEIASIRTSLESELALVPDFTERVRRVSAEKKAGNVLTKEDAELLRKARYLSALRIVHKALSLLPLG